ncbi:diguanylate cyclase [Propionivibrio sp.]|uniref:diguanylate cyclase domain-containing protein n=1 Tax=Propionivibrio sp. TaxID=2212460 RepID=UPI0025CFEAB3|nr:diguanylate cyclase [Propionivibrio sp.]MBK7356721.1 diguanylate cyclase [Propionivibrio sp.]MBK8401127.1 diguanylate cyclase [Propionivibrio sp.]MBK8743658.1 diguanylate cyclase [Propionivibrio sp.]MBL0208459.1 diguanylate cyclase [Propionivibrio sp.]
MPDIKPNSSASSFTVDQLRKRYIVALGLIALLIVASQGIMQCLISDQEHDSRVVNIAGRQRMLSQRITKQAYYIAKADSAQTAADFRHQLQEVLGLWERSHKGLLHGDAELGLPGDNSSDVIALFERITPDYLAIVDATKNLLSASERGEPIDQDILLIRNHERSFLQGMDEIVFRYDQEAMHRINVARWLALGLMAIILVALALEAMLIFAPATRRIRHDMRSLEKKEEDMSSLFSANPTAMLLVDKKDLAILKANQQSADLLSCTVQDITRNELRNYFDGSCDTNNHFLDKLINNTLLSSHEVVLLDSQRSQIFALASVREISFAGEDVYVLGLMNISELKKAQQTLEYYAAYDEMTGLLNRRTGFLVLAKALARAKRDLRQLTVCFLDLDGLKTTNDRFGHAEGDWMLCTTAKALTNSIRSGDVAVRLGGDEFLLIFHDCPVLEASRLLARIEDYLSAVGTQEHKPFPITVSYGLAAYDPILHSTPDDLIAEADALMYIAKQKRQRIDANDPT